VSIDDAEDIFRWRSSRSGLYLRQPEGYSIERQRDWICSRSKNEANYIIYAKDINEKIGTVGIYDVNWADKVANVGRLLLDEKYLTQSNPYGLDTLKITYNFLFENMKFRKITGDILGVNTNMYKLQKFLGMQQEGYLKSHVNINNQYYDLYIMSLFEADFMKYKSKIDVLLRNFR
jgi:RimJ/RimL family protein N-acetyltransferase